ncbi:polysaccharide deacetylase family protein [bacterium]|nr:MAG: polysaccharide deacetylase family protein [bacterium]
MIFSNSRQSPFEVLLKKNTDRPRWQHIVAFCALVPVIWGANFLWRPPAPMLGLKHEEHLGRGSTNIAVTFDDAPHPLTTPLLLASLKRADVKATFFCIGGNLRLYPELAHRMVEEGHELANHSEPHHNLTTVDPKSFFSHIDEGFASIARVERDAGKTGPTTRLYRPPGGGLNRAAMQYLYDRNYTLAWWSNNVGDWTCPPAWKIADGVKAHLEPGDIILLHDGGTGTPQALPNIIKAARLRGMSTILMPQQGAP